MPRLSSKQAERHLRDLPGCMARAGLAGGQLVGQLRTSHSQACRRDRGWHRVDEHDRVALLAVVSIPPFSCDAAGGRAQSPTVPFRP